MVITGDDKATSDWYKIIEKTKEKARGLQGKIIGINQTGFIMIGKLIDVEIDRLWRFKFPYCKLSMKNPTKFKTDGKVYRNMGEEEIAFVNKPSMVLSMKEIDELYPDLFKSLSIIIRSGGERWR